MRDDSERRDPVDQLLTTGLRNRWWCIGPSAMFQDKPVALMRLGERLVGWRDSAGQLNLIADQCPHRGIALSLGRVIEGNIACRYHGVRVAGDGTVAAVPALPDCNLVGRKLVCSYPVIEHFQGVWAYFGDESHQEPCALQLPPELVSPEWTGLVVSSTWGCNYQYVLDNLVDPMHTTYLHEESYSMGIDARTDLVDVKATPTGLLVTRRNDPSNIEAMEFIDTGAFFVRVGISLPASLGPGGILRVITTVVPIDEQTCQINFWRLRKVSGWQAALFRFMYNAVYDRFTWEVLEQDRDALDRMPPWPAPENLYQHDTGVARLRRYLRMEAETQCGIRSVAE
jgi:phenylpropionate dioxygenase-like ring-hydroxylating dioxygenase large terminal subunit